jgi:hypothetical protein
MLYLDDVPHVEVGVVLDRACPLTGRVRASAIYGPHDDDPARQWVEVGWRVS